MPECRDPEIGKFLHAYELGILSQEDNDLFEEHLLKCEFCFNEILAFDGSTELIISDVDVRTAVAKFDPGPDRDEKLAVRLKKYLWPQIPAIFRPAFIYIIVVLLIIPVALIVPTYLVRGPSNSDTPTVAAFQEIYLSPLRDSGVKTFYASRNADGIINVVCPDAVPGRSYHITITNEDNNLEVLRYIAYSGFDEYGKVGLIFPHSKMIPANYTVRVEDYGSDQSDEDNLKEDTILHIVTHGFYSRTKPEILREYNFSINE